MNLIQLINSFIFGFCAFIFIKTFIKHLKIMNEQRFNNGMPFLRCRIFGHHKITRMKNETDGEIYCKRCGYICGGFGACTVVENIDDYAGKGDIHLGGKGGSVPGGDGMPGLVVGDDPTSKPGEGGKGGKIIVIENENFKNNINY